MPESDPNVALINDRILEMKEKVEKASTDRVQLLVTHRRLSDQRAAKFLSFFDAVEAQVQ